VWDNQGRAPYVIFSDGTRQRCIGSRCLDTYWVLGWRAYGARSNGAVLSAGGTQAAWLGNVMEDHHDASGLLYRRNRYYNPQTARFTQEDPIGLAGGMNVYGFAEGDPATYADPYGLTPCWILDPSKCNFVFLASLLGRSQSETKFIFDHPRAAWRANGIVRRAHGQAFRMASTGRIPGGVEGMHNGPGDAVRHATGMCELTRALGAQTAEAIGNNHEQDDSPAGEKRMDQHNNAVGRRIASQRGTCIDNAVSAWDRGDLQAMQGASLPGLFELRR
jgi:RHS repeat-associated protein